jgi:hypothetical protein
MRQLLLFRCAGMWCSCCNMQLHRPCSSHLALCSFPPYLLPQADDLTFVGRLCPVEFSPPTILHQVWFAVTGTVLE